MTSNELKHRAALEAWAGRISQCRTSGKSVVKWCEENQINIKTYYYWEKRCLAEYERQNQAKQGNLVKVEPKMLQTGDAADTQISNSCITMEIGNVKLTFPTDTGMAQIAELISELNRHV